MVGRPENLYEENPEEENPEKREGMVIDASTPESMWQVKPWWCQPWSIVLTGVALPMGSWLVLHRLWITLPVMAAIALWWLLFLWLVPTQYTAAVRAAKGQS